MADRKSVRAELERKRIQLAQMRQERERRSRMLQEDENTLQNSDIKMEDADAVLHALGLSGSLSRASTAPSNVSSMDRTSTQSPDVSQLSNIPAKQEYPSSLNENFVMQSSSPKTAVPLQVVHVNQINIPPKERVYYTKSTQTPAPPAPSSHQQIQQSSVEGQEGTQQSDAPQQKSYYGKQIINNNNNTQVSGVNQLGLEWDDEFPGMFRIDLEQK